VGVWVCLSCEGNPRTPPCSNTHCYITHCDTNCISHCDDGCFSYCDDQCDAPLSNAHCDCQWGCPLQNPPDATKRVNCYNPNWTEEVFILIPRICMLTSFQGEKNSRTFYKPELLKANQNKYRIENIIRKNKNSALVKQFRYSKKYSLWIPIEDLKISIKQSLISTWTK